MKKSFLNFIFLCIALLAVGIYLLRDSRPISLPQVPPFSVTPSSSPLVSPLTSSSNPSAQPAVLGIQTKETNCQPQGPQGVFPDPECTPGAVLPNVTKEEVCTSGYSATVRNVPQSEKDQVYAEYGITQHTAGEYEVDHFISLELGGSNDISNLWPEPASPTPGFHQKDTVENYLHKEVCDGKITLEEAQREISTNWLSVFQQMSVQ